MAATPSSGTTKPAKAPAPKSAAPQKTPAAPAAPKVTGGATLAVIRIRGDVNINEPVRRTFQQLNLFRKNYCTLVPSTPSHLGMIEKLDPFITWGEINDATKKELVAKRGEESVIDGKKTQKPFFRLAPPRKGFERKGTKKAFSQGGAYGYRGEKINDLITRML